MSILSLFRFPTLGDIWLPRRDPGNMATPLRRFPLDWPLQPLSGDEPTSGLYPSRDEATRLSIRAGMRADNW